MAIKTTVPTHIMNFLREVALSNDISREIRSKALDYFVAENTGSLRILVNGKIFLVSHDAAAIIGSYYKYGRKIEAIKAFRAATRAGLKDSKNAVEQYGNFFQKHYED